MQARRRPNRRPQRQTTKSEGLEQSQLETLRKISEQLKLDQFGFSPDIVDVPRIRLKDKVHTFSRTINTLSITTSNTIPGAVGLQFVLNDLPNSTDFTSLFDQYRIIQVSVRLLPTLAAQTSPVYSWIDYDDSLTPSALSEGNQRSTLMCTQSNQVHERVLNPRLSSALYAGSVSSGYSSEWGTWIDANYPAVSHYGLKIFAPAIASGSAVTNAMSVSVEYIVQCRSVL